MESPVTWEKIEPEKPPEHYLKIDDFNLGVTFDERKQRVKFDIEKRKEIKEKVLELLQVSYEYVYPIIKDIVPLNENLTVELTDSLNYGRSGALMRVPAKWFTQDLLIDSSNEKTNFLHTSLFVHEILHNVTEHENFTMFIEMIYMLENGQQWRIEDIKKLYLENKLGGKPYEKGLEDIAQWLGFPEILSMLDALPKMNRTLLKEIFKKELAKYWQEELALINKQN